ncbi:hypothetical protein SAMN04244572_03772 [Azotobacter beijerinckii]|uniref:Uncharacterized protein n=1 Tax=Azotobacter beijerinckii TaxID=170623 RepID=A0A1H6YG67_9GAMM|nr:hypothetical protein [Azotobacter beijerinckii]SEJ38854.1 hypothetical protein SAMN04244572_03772 [Azotobacter beijerinckii]
MSQHLADDLPGGTGGGRLRVWLKASAYTRRLLLGSGGDPWVSAPQYLAYFSQAQGLLRPDVAVVEVGEMFDSWLSRHPEVAAELGSKRRLSFPLRKLLEQDEPRQILAEVVEAVIANLRGQTPLVLAMPSPKHWLRHANALAGRVGVELDPDGIEDAAMYMADLMRSVSAYPVGGVLLEEHPTDSDMEATDVERYRPLINVAKHYRWSLALRPRGAAPASPALAEFDAVISPIIRVPKPASSGVDVGAVLWHGGSLPVLDQGQFYFVEIPAEQQPELVLESLAWLRA